MPELPEVETVRRGIAPIWEGNSMTLVTVHRHDLRLPIPQDLASQLTGRTVIDTQRRGKFLLAYLDNQQVCIIHLGMSGKLMVYNNYSNSSIPHDHVILRLSGGQEVRFNDPRRFGMFTLASASELSHHPLLAGLGVEPLEYEFNAEYLSQAWRNKKQPVKQAIMDGRVVVGVGNIYASESLYRAHIHPDTAAKEVAANSKNCSLLVQSVKEILTEAIASGGSTIRDYVRSSGDSGYFQHHFAVYGKEGEACAACTTIIKRTIHAGRSTFFCEKCQN